MFLFVSISYLLLLLPGIPYYIGLILLLLGVFITSLKRPDLGLIMISFLVSSYVLVRWKSDSFILSGFRSEIFAVFILACILRAINIKKENLLKLPNEPILLLFILWSLLCFFFHSNANPALFLLAVRENLEAWLLFPIVVNLLKKDMSLLKLTIYALVFGCAFVALVNVGNYYGIININISEYAVRGTYVHQRTIAGFNIKRINPFFGVGPSGGGQYYSVICIQSFLLLYSLLREFFLRNKSIVFWSLALLLFFSSLIMTWAIILTVSISSLGAVSIAILAANLRLRGSINLSFMVKLLFLMPAVIFLLFFLDLNQFGINKYDNPFSYFTDGFAAKGFNLLSTTTNLFFGNSLSLRTGTSQIGSLELGVVDVSWFILVEKMGIVGLIIGLSFTGKYLYKFLTASVPKVSKELFLMAGIMLFSLMSYSHNSPMILRPFDYLFMLSTASLFAGGKSKALS
jgi:hypothetical protein